MRKGRVNRREFITLLGGAAAAWPLAARAQQTVPVIGYLDFGSPEPRAYLVAAFRRGLSEIGYTEGRNVVIEYRWAEDRFDRLPELAADLVRRKVSVIAAPANNPARAAKTATSEIPIVFGVGEDPVKLGLVASLARPGGNATGINLLTGEVVAKRLGLLRELVPAAVRLAVLANPANPITSSMLGALEPAARGLAMQVQTYNAGTIGEIDAAFAAFVSEQPHALFVAPDAFFLTRRVQLAALTVRHALPAVYSVRQFVEVGGLLSYGTSLLDMYRQVGVYTGRILTGVKPEDLPVVQSSKFELVINAQIARILGLAIPPPLLALADEVIE
jgi:putative ABC transport system substrate-binding protein